jgi:hypothetical protein
MGELQTTVEAVTDIGPKIWWIKSLSNTTNRILDVLQEERPSHN